MARVLQGPIVEEAVQGALESEAVKRALLEAMDSELVDEVWRRLLASEEAQQLVERIAEAPEVRAAISAQGAGLLEDIGRTIGKLARSLDDSFERIVRRIFFRAPARVAEQPRRRRQPRPGLSSIDGVFVNLGFTAARRPRDAGRQRLRRQRRRRLAASRSRSARPPGWRWARVYLVGFWSLAGQTPGMRFVGIRLSVAAPAAAALRSGA